MRSRTLIAMLAATCLSLVAADPDSATRTGSLTSYGKLPLQFEANAGGTDSRVKFLARGGGYTLLLTADEAILSLRRSKPQSEAAANIEMKLVGANGHATVLGMNGLPGKVNYIVGKDAANWRIGVPTFAKVKYQQVYPGIDLIYYGNQSHLEYDFVLAAGVDPSTIRLRLNGARPRLNAQGDVVLTVGTEQVSLRKPVVYQMNGSAKQMVPCSFVLARNDEVRFTVGRYDRSRSLVIDPVLVYTSYLGGTENNDIRGLAVNSSGQLYVTGYTSAVNFPTTPGSYQPTSSVPPDAFVSKISADGKTLLYSTYLGGTGADGGIGVAVDANDNAYVTGYTESGDFPVTPDAIQSQCGPQGVPSNGLVGPYNSTQPTCGSGQGDVFLTKLNPTGTQLLYSTFLGGDRYDTPTNIGLDSQGNVYIAGYTNSISTDVVPNGSDVDYPVTTSAYQSSNAPFNSSHSLAAFITKLSPDLHTLMYSSIIGSESNNSINQGMALGQNGIVFIGGSTLSPVFPVKNAFQTSCETPSPPNGSACYNSGFISAFDTTASGDASLVSSTYLNDGLGTPAPLGISLGNSGYAETQVHALAADAQNNVYVTGETTEINFPTTPGAYSTACSYDTTKAICGAAIVLKFSPSGALLWSTYFGSSSTCCNVFGFAIALDSNNNVYVTGGSEAVIALPLKNPFQAGPARPFDQITAYVWTLSSDGSQLLFSSYFGGGGSDTPTGIALDRAGNIYFAGRTTSPDLPVTPGTVQTIDPGFQQGFFAKASCISTPCPTLPSLPVNSISLMVAPGSATLGQLVTMTATVTGQPNQPTPTGSVTFYNGPTPLGQMTLNGSGIATFTSTSLAVGSYAVTATYSGDNLYFGNTSAAESLTLSAAATTIAANNVALTFSPNAQQIALNAAVTSGSGTVNGGSVSFTLLGTTVSGAVGSGLAGASFTVPGGTAAGQYAIAAAYSASGNFAASSDNTKQLSISKATPVITWANPAAIPSGTALGSAQLNATASVPGSFVYNPPVGTVLGYSQTLSATFTPTDSAEYNPATASVPINVGAAALIATTTVTNNVAVTYNYSQSPQQITLSATVTSSSGVVNIGLVTFGVLAPLGILPTSVPVHNGFASASFTLPGGLLALPVGNYAIKATYDPGFEFGTNNPFAASSDNTKQLSVLTATLTLVITWANPAPIAYGTPLGLTQLDAVAGPAGLPTCLYNYALGTVLPSPGTYTLSTTCTEGPVSLGVVDIKYLPATATVTLQVLPTLVITWANPAPIAYGTALGLTQLDAVASPAGLATCLYNYALGTVLPSPGTYTLSTTCTEAPVSLAAVDIKYLPATATVTLQVLGISKKTPSIAWAIPSDIQSGTALGSAQLNATASVGAPLIFNLPGTFVYNPPPGTVLPVGNGQILSVTFTPADSTDYTTATASVGINVSAAATTVVPNNVTAAYSAFPSVITLSATVTNAPPGGGFVGFTLLGGQSNGLASIINGSASVSFTLPGGTLAGSYPIMAYFYTFNTGMLSASGTAQFIIPDVCPATTASPTAVLSDATVTLTRLSGPKSASGKLTGASPSRGVSAADDNLGFTSTGTVTGGQYVTSTGSIIIIPFTLIVNVASPANLPPLISITPLTLQLITPEVLNTPGSSQMVTAPPPTGPITACQTVTFTGQVPGLGLPSGTPAVLGLSTTLQDPVTKETFGLQITHRIVLNSSGEN